MVFIANSCDDGAGSSSSGGSTPSYSYSPDSTLNPSPEPEDLAFQAVRSGDCLDVYDDGYGDWSARAPERVDCDSAHAYVYVTSASTSADCRDGQGEDTWTHSGADGSETVLCLARQFRTGQCFTADIRSDDRARADLMVVWSCGSGKVPSGDTHIMQITGYYKKPSGREVNCGNDNTRYWTWDVDNGKRVICAKVV